jgi:glycosyltransferase involved in cell wall biosynthesis
LLGSIKEIVFKLTRRSKEIEQVIKKLNPVAIHAHFGPDATIINKIANKLNIPLIVSFHGYDVSKVISKKRISNLMYKSRLNNLIKNCFKCAVASEFMKNKVLEIGFPKNKIFSYKHGIKINKNKNKIRENLVLFVGRLVEKKGCKYLIDAMEIVQKEIPSISIIIIGDGYLKEDLKKRAHSKIRNFKFIRYQTHKNVLDYMERSKLLCVPSLISKDGDPEGFGLVFIEAQSKGLPIISTLSGGIPEAVKDKITGFLVKEKDSEKIAEKIILLVRNNKIWKKMSTSGIKNVRKNFNIKNNVKNFEQVYKLAEKSQKT